MGNNAVAGTEAVIWTRGWTQAARRGLRADGHAQRDGPREGHGERHPHPQECQQEPGRDGRPGRERHGQEQRRGAEAAIPQEQAPHRCQPPARGRGGRLAEMGRGGHAGEEPGVHPVQGRPPDRNPCPRHDARLPEGRQEPGGRRALPLDHLQLEAIRPRQERPPDELVQQDDDEHEGADPAEDRPRVALARRLLEISPQPRETEVALPDMEDLGRHEEEPPARPTHDTVPDEAEGREGEFEGREAEPGWEAEGGTGLAEFHGDGRERLIPGEGEVPRLAGEDQHDGRQLHGQPLGQDRGEAEEDHGEEGEDGHTLQHVEQWEQDALGAPVAGGKVAVRQGEEEREEVGGQHAEARQARVPRQRAGRERDLGAADGRGGAQSQPDAGVKKDGEADHDHRVGPGRRAVHRGARAKDVLGAWHRVPWRCASRRVSRMTNLRGGSIGPLGGRHKRPHDRARQGADGGVGDLAAPAE